MSSHAKKLIFFVTEDWYFVSHRMKLALAAKKSGYDVAVITRVIQHGKFIKDSGIRVIPFGMSRKGMNPVTETIQIFKLWGIYNKENPDILHHVAIKPVIYGSIAAKFSRCNNVVNALTGMGYIFISNQLKAKLLRPLVKLAFRVFLNEKNSYLVLQNKDDLNMLLNANLIEPNSTSLIKGSGVDLSEFYPMKNTSNIPVVMLASRLLWDKGVGEFVEASKILREQNVNARFVLVGDADSDNPSGISLKQLTEWKNSEVIEWWGHSSNMLDSLSKADILCLPSYREGLPKVLLEGASCELPLVATDVPGCREIVRNGENGLLVPVQNATALALALHELINDKDERILMGKKGRKIVEHEFSDKVILEKFLNLYKTISG